MLPLQGKTIVLGVSGGIAAYKAAALTSKLTQAGADVHVILTERAARFVQPLTFQTLSRNHVHTDLFAEPDPARIAHIHLADRADLVLVAPATANLIGKLACGIADDMLTTTLLATRAPVMLAPAMNVNMYHHPAVTDNLKRLQERGVLFVEPGEGLLACGWVGKGRLAEPEEILAAVIRFFQEQAKDAELATERDLKGWKVLVTAGPTRERIDPVRYISNHSSGKMGYAIAEAARDRGADVVLVSGPTALPRPEGVAFVPVESVQDMYEAVMIHLSECDVVVKAAAVSDYRPKTVYAHKVKKLDQMTLELEKAPDILEEVGRRKGRQFVVGFAAETNDVLRYAREKLARKNLDMIVANDVLREGAGMGVDTNIVTIVTREGETASLEKMSKRDVADKLWDAVRAKRAGRPLADVLP